MDFDDLDEVEEANAPAAAEEAAAAAEPGAAGSSGAARRPAEYVPEGYMPPIPRNFRLPDFNELPPQIEKLLPEQGLHMKAKPKVCIRAFVFYGAGDTWYAWANLAATAPPYCEVAVHEWPSHGQRDEEDPAPSLEVLANDAFRAVKPAMEQHAKGGRIAGAPFVLIGHSIGCLVVVALAQRLRAEMQLEPAAVVMLDRAAPHIPLHSEYGQKYRDESPWDFMRDYNDMVYNAAKGAGGEKGEKMIKMWVNDVKIGSDTRPQGFHTFDCDLLLLRAMENFFIEQMKDSPDQALAAKHATRDKLMGSPPGMAADCSMEQYEEWARWTSGRFILKDIKTDHVRIKSHREALDHIWELCAEKKAPDPK